MKIRLSVIAFSLLAFISLMSGCSTTKFEPGASTQTVVGINQANYQVIHAGATGTSYGFRFLGIFPFANASASQARANLYKHLDVSPQGKSIALINTTQDKGGLYLILFSLPRIVVQGDVIQYITAPSPIDVPSVSPRLLVPTASK